MSLASYLAEHYLTAEKPEKKSKKRKTKQGSVMIKDEDVMGWSERRSRRRRSQPNDDDDDDDDDDEDDCEEGSLSGPAAASRKSALQARTKKKSWKKITSLAASAANPDRSGTDRGERFEGAVQSAGRDDEDGDKGGKDEVEKPVLMSSGARAGLQTASQVTADIRAREEADRKAMLAAKRPSKEDETIYRDATGRRIDLALQRAEAQKQALLQEERKKRDEILGKGLAQIRMKEQKARDMEAVRTGKFSRTADDEALNKEQKAKQYWDDPALQLIQAENDKQEVKTPHRRTKSKRPIYQGSAPPNRFEILPGYRWDGVDRSNGFEEAYFLRVNEAESKKQEHYKWSVEDM